MRVRLMSTVQTLGQWAIFPRANKDKFYFQPRLHKRVSVGFHVNNHDKRWKVFRQAKIPSIVLDNHWGSQCITAHSLCVRIIEQKSTSASVRHFSLYNSFHRRLTITHFRSTLLGPLCLTGAHVHWMTHRAKNLQFRNGLLTLLLHEFGFPTLHLRTVEPERRASPSIVVFFYPNSFCSHSREMLQLSQSDITLFLSLLDLLVTLFDAFFCVKRFRVLPAWLSVFKWKQHKQPLQCVRSFARVTC